MRKVELKSRQHCIDHLTTGLFEKEAGKADMET